MQPKAKKLLSECQKLIHHPDLLSLFEEDSFRKRDSIAQSFDTLRLLSLQKELIDFTSSLKNIESKLTLEKKLKDSRKKVSGKKKAREPLDSNFTQFILFLRVGWIKAFGIQSHISSIPRKNFPVFRKREIALGDRDSAFAYLVYAVATISDAENKQITGSFGKKIQDTLKQIKDQGIDLSKDLLHNL